jgi:hypothetical protein
MTVRKHNDQGFDDFRRERKRLMAKLGPQSSALGYENQALRQLEQVEAEELRDRQLTREVHEFFASATRQAAAIVDRVAKDAQQEAGARVEEQMEQFLIDALGRMNSFVLTVLQQRRGPVAETRMEPSIGNLPQPTLDEFRFAGTADTGDKHIGKDPFATTIDEVQREFRASVGDGADSDLAVPIDQHLVASMAGQQAAEDVAEEAVVAPAEAADASEPEPDISIRLPEPPAPVARVSAVSVLAKPTVAKATEPPPAAKSTPKPTPDKAAPAPRAAAPTPAPAQASAPATSTPVDELERFKGALKALVRQGVMSREEARAAWDTRLQALGMK